MSKEIRDLVVERDKLNDNIAKTKSDRDELQRKYDAMKKDQKNVAEDIHKRQSELEDLRKENDKLNEQYKNVKMKSDSTMHTDVEKLKNIIEKLTMENEILKADDDVSSKLKGVLDDAEKWKKTANDLALENALLTDNLEDAIEDLQKIKYDGEQMIGRGSNARAKVLMEKTQPEDVEQWRWEVERLQEEIERLKRENEILMGNRDEPMTMQQLVNELDKRKKKAVNLSKENIRMKSGYENLRENDKRQFDDTQITKNIKNERVPFETPDMLNEFIRALDVIRMKMEKQRKAVVGIREIINNIEGHSRSDYSMHSESDDSIILDTVNPIIVEVLELSSNLSANIFSAKKEVMNLAQALRARWNENTRLKKLVEDLDGVETFQAMNLLDESAVRDDDTLDVDSWLETLTLTQLAALHDKICLLTSALVREDANESCCRRPNHTSITTYNYDQLKQSYDALNRKIAALQRQIGEKQSEAGKKVMELRQALRQEQAELIRISEAMNQERKRNLVLHLMVDESPCWINNCTAECANNIKFVSSIAQKK